MTYDIDDVYIGKICMLSNNSLHTCPFYSAFYKKYNETTKKDEYYLINRGKKTHLTIHFKHHKEFDSVDDLITILDDEEEYYYVDKLIKMKDAIGIEPTPRTLEVFEIHSFLSYINKLEKEKHKIKIKRK